MAAHTLKRHMHATKEGGLPAGLATDAEAHDAWFRAKVKEAVADTCPAVPHRLVMNEVQARIYRKRVKSGSSR